MTPRFNWILLKILETSRIFDIQNLVKTGHSHLSTWFCYLKTQELCCNDHLLCSSQPHLLQFYFLQEAATAISEEVSILRTDETDSRVIMSGQREVSTALIICHISTVKFPWVPLRHSFSNHHLFSKMVVQDSFGIGIKVIILYWSSNLYFWWLNWHACY